jgi:zinc protease
MSGLSPARPKSSPSGTRLFVEHSHVLPLVDIEIAMPVGSLQDPPGKEGLAQMTGALIRKGPSGMSPERFEERLAGLGARMSVEVSMRSTRIHATVISRNLEPLLRLLSEMLWRPAMRAADFAQLKRTLLASFVARLDDDHALGALCAREKLFEGHPYARPTGGNAQSLRHISRKDVGDFYARYLEQVPVLVGVAGDVNQRAVQQWLRADFPRRRQRDGRLAVPAPRLLHGRRVFIVDKPDRVQAQLFIGTLGARTRDPLLFPLIVGNTAFGGTFTGRLMHEVRSQRGWSYGAYSRLLHADQRDAWYMWTAPSVEYAAECAALQIELMETWLQGGIRGAEARFAKKYLVNSHCFDQDTPVKRLEARMEIDLLGVPASHVYDYVNRVKAVTTQRANQAVASRLSAKDLTIVAVASAADIADSFERIPGLDSLQIVPYRDL